MFKSLAVSFALLLAAVAVAGAAGPELKSDEQKTLYALGLVISQNLASFNLNASDLESVLAGVSDGVLKKDYKVDVQTYAPKIQQLQTARAGVAGGEREEGGPGLPRQGRSRERCDADGVGPHHHDLEAGDRTVAEGDRQGEGPLSRYPHRRHRVR
jgi:hypothetical protein